MLGNLSRIGLGTALAATCVTSIIIVAFVNNVVFIGNFKDSAIDAMKRRADAFTAVANEAKNYQSERIREGAVNIDGLLKAAKEDLAAGKHYSDTKFFRAIPVIAGWDAAKRAAEKENLNFKILAFEERNKENAPKPGSFAESLLRRLTNQVAAGGSDTIAGVHEESNTLHYMRAIKLDESCMRCHGKPGNKYDADGDGKDPLGFDMEGWDVGYMHGAYDIEMPLAPADAQAASFLTEGLSWTIPLVIGIVIALLALMRVIFKRPMQRTIERLRDIAEGEGDLTHRLDASSKNELGTMAHWFNAFLSKLEVTIQQVAGGANEMYSGSQQVATSSAQLSNGATQQAASLQEISASIEETASAARRNAESAQEATKLAEKSKSATARGREHMTAMNSAMKEIKESSDRVGEIIQVIDDIAFQTNLLALNAAVEASRAGDSGRGFAVVADEVRSLALRSAEAAQQTATLLKESMSRADHAVTVSEQVADVLGDISDRTVEVDTILRSICESSSQQSSGLAQISDGTADLERVTQQNAANSEELAAAAQETSSQSATLERVVGAFKVGDS